jgi:hypothetical protein
VLRLLLLFGMPLLLLLSLLMSMLLLYAVLRLLLLFGMPLLLLLSLRLLLPVQLFDRPQGGEAMF